jgi:aryl-alcohol dehydrogenase-like predicted oxidoreductase
MSDTIALADFAARAEPAVAKLGLGTVQFGMPYGLAQPQRVVAHDEIAGVLTRAWQAGVDLIDTAAAYGDSESAIGELRPAAAAFTIVTKTLPIRAERISASDVERVVGGVRASAARLRVSALDALLVHESKDLLAEGGEALFTALQSLKRDGLVKRLGVSVYEPAVLDDLIARFPIELVQLPLNVFDQRFARQGQLLRWAARGIEIHARSVFLQGLLLRDPGNVPAHLARAAAPLTKFRQRAREAGLDPLAAALAFAVQQAGVSRAVIGVDGLAELEANLSAYAQARQRGMDFATLAVDDPNLTDPRLWSK